MNIEQNVLALPLVTCDNKEIKVHRMNKMRSR